MKCANKNIEMARWLFLCFAVVLLTPYVCDAISLIGGHAVHFPLAPTDPMHFATMFHLNGTLVTRCMERKAMQNTVALFKHNTCIQNYASATKTRENAEPIKECGINRKFLMCMKTVMKELDTLCAWTEAEATVYNYRLDSFEAGLDQACGNSAALYSKFITGGGPQCLTQAHEHMKGCQDTWGDVSGEYVYNKANCDKGWGFVLCMVDAYADYCDHIEYDFVDKIIRVVSKGLAVTPCGKYIVKGEEDIISAKDVIAGVDALPETLPSMEDVEAAMKEEESPPPQSEKKTDDGNGAAAGAKNAMAFLWTLMLYKLIAA